MCTEQQLALVMRQVVEATRAAFGASVRQVILFGSYARGAAEEDSDVDVMILLDLPREQLPAHRRAAARIAADLLDEYGVVVSPLLESEAFFARNRTTYPFFRNIDREGIRYVA